MSIGENNELEFIEEIQGDTISDVLSYVEHQPHELFQQFRAKAEEAVRGGEINMASRQE